MEQIRVNGMVIKSAPAGDYDKRLVLLTRERGRITAFARGARRLNHSLMAGTRPFAFGVFTLYPGRDAYSVQGAEISNYFDELSLDVEKACYASYFLELAEYYTKENMDGTQMLKLLYQSFRALLKPSIPNALIWRIFELRAMGIGGEYTEAPPMRVGDAAAYAWEFVLTSPIEKLYTFRLADEAAEEFSKAVQKSLKCHVEGEFHSLEVLQLLQPESKRT
ncbi:MAG: DNA repair protein RecO [bacterium]|nr:DNA repair protein RecO [bacterium]